MVSKVVFTFAIFAIILVNAVENEGEGEHDDGPVEYEFSYSVHDDHTKDIKSHREHRKDDKVEGSYELIDSDGFKRFVEYKSDKHAGFTAIVHREPTDIKVPIPEHHIAEASEHHKIVAPVVHYAKVVPVAKVVVPAPKIIKVARAALPHYGGLSSHYGANHVTFQSHGNFYHY